MSDINITNIDDCALKYTATPKASCSHRYQIEKKLSHKAGRQTLLALDLVTHQQVVIKILQFDSLFEWDDLKLFEREAKTLKNLNNPAIPKYLGYFEIDNEQIQGFALVQTYIDAPSLEDTIRQGRKFTEAELIELAQKLLKILDYLHSSNPPVIHRDIKPSNILLSNRTRNSIGELYLVDFGSVQTAASKSEGTITIVGSYGYIPLEQFGGQTTTASDLYSLGMTLIYLITGVHPAELPQTDGRVKFEDSQLSDGLKRWLAKMTEPYLDKRFDSAESALTGLLIKEQSSGIFFKLRPHNTKIKLYRDRHKLDIVFDRGSFKPSLLRR
ncbi:MAG: serine/threonine-protein kinase, partial [Cyanobacteria bacterium J06635_13]